MQHLAGDLELTGGVLACDCEMDMVCEGGALAGLVFEFGQPPARAKKKRQAGASGQVRRVLAAVAALPPTVGAVIPYWSQEAAFCSLYPPHYFENFCFLMVEDLVNQPPFTCFTQWLCSRGLRWDGPLVPMLASPPAERLLARTAQGSRRGRCLGRRAVANRSHPWICSLQLLWRAIMAACGNCRREPSVPYVRHLSGQPFSSAIWGSWACLWCCCPGAM